MQCVANIFFLNVRQNNSYYNVPCDEQGGNYQKLWTQ